MSIIPPYLTQQQYYLPFQLTKRCYVVNAPVRWYMFWGEVPLEPQRDLAIVLKTFRYGERDLVVVFFSEHHGKITALAKGAVHSRRFGGALSFLAASQLAWVLRPNADMGRIDEAVIRQEFSSIHRDYHLLTVASLMAEVCLKLLEPGTAARDLFVILSNALFQLDRGAASVSVIDAFLVKALQVLGYAPQLLRCGVCEVELHQVAQDQNIDRHTPLGWDPAKGHVSCPRCRSAGEHSVGGEDISIDAILLYCDFLVKPFKELGQLHAKESWALQLELYRKLILFLHYHVSALQGSGGLKTLSSIDEQAFMTPAPGYSQDRF